MNGVHDTGGMHGMGPIQYESDEPVFHERATPCILICGTTTLSALKSMLDPERLQALPQPPQEGDESVFVR